MSLRALVEGVGAKGRALVVAAPLVWLSLFFLLPFVILAKISVSEPAIARPPYLPIWEWADGMLNISRNNFV